MACTVFLLGTAGGLTGSLFLAEILQPVVAVGSLTACLGVSLIAMVVVAMRVADGVRDSSTEGDGSRQSDNANAEFDADNERAHQLEIELARARRSAELARRAKSEFLGRMSHEIRTPLHGLIGMTRLALENKSPELQREYLETSLRSAENLQFVVDELFDFSNLDAGVVALTSDTICLTSLLEKVCGTHASDAQEKGVELIWNLTSSVPETVTGDLGRLEQILNNLIANAIKFTDAGEVVVEVAAATIAAEKIVLRFSVNDSGIGFEAESQEDLFEPFFQADTSDRRPFGGIGLGLAICRHLVTMMGGEIWAHSEPGKGSRFEFTVTLDRCLDAEREQSPPPSLAGLSLLHVEPNATSRRIVGGWFHGWAVRSTAVANAAEAAEALDQAEAAARFPQVVLLDDRLADDVVLDRLSAIPRSDRPALILTRGQLGDLDWRLGQVSDAILAKPLSPPVVRKALAAAATQRLVGDVAEAATLTEAERSEAPAMSADVEPHRLTVHVPARVLVVEDHPVNQKVAVHMLRQAGLQVEVADDGAVAVEMVQAEDFDLILMDVHMPHLDGLGATRIIRRRERDSRGRHIPIIAVTACATPGDRERCLRAGMDGYLSKPLDTKSFERTLAAFLPAAFRKPVESELSGNGRAACSHAHVDTDPPAQANPGDDGQDPSDDPDWFDVEEALARVSGNRRVFCEMLQVFLEEAPKMMANVESAVAQGDAAALHRSAHLLKGSLSNFSAKIMTRTALELEVLGASAEMEHAAKELLQLQQQWQRLEPQMRQYSESS